MKIRNRKQGAAKAKAGEEVKKRPKSAYLFFCGEKRPEVIVEYLTRWWSNLGGDWLRFRVYGLGPDPRANHGMGYVRGDGGDCPRRLVTHSPRYHRGTSFIRNRRPL